MAIGLPINNLPIMPDDYDGPGNLLFRDRIVDDGIEDRKPGLEWSLSESGGDKKSYKEKGV
jgi:hypothetical protein